MSTPQDWQRIAELGKSQAKYTADDFEEIIGCERTDAGIEFCNAAPDMAGRLLRINELLSKRLRAMLKAKGEWGDGFIYLKEAEARELLAILSEGE